MPEYEQVRSHLLEMLEDLNSRLNNITDEVKHNDAPLSANFAEQVVEMENNEVLDALGNATRLEIEKIKHAIIKMDKGEYGLCQVCGEAISPERLAVIPFSNMCIKCANQAEGC